MVGRRLTVLIPLDFSAVFDTVDHPVLINRLRALFGFHGTVLEWLCSYLEDRSQAVSIQGQLSNAITLQYGVPQGSVLGPLLFLMYTKPLGDIAHIHGVNIHMYADDTQIYASFEVNDANDRNITSC